MKKLQVIYTGGTIGMVPGPDGLAPGADLPRQLTGIEGVQLDWNIWPTLLDSSNMEPKHWCRLGQEIISSANDADGYVVLHGTDTMAYTAASLSWQLRGLNRPVVLTGSQRPFGAGDSDARDNWLGALNAACLPGLKEVAIYFGERLLRGSQCTKISSSAFQAFDTPRGPRLGEGNPLKGYSEHFLPASTQPLQPVRYDQHPVRIAHWAPGLPPATLHQIADSGCRAVILVLFGSGTGPDQNPAFIDAIASLTQRDILVAGISACPHGNTPAGTYASGSHLIDAGMLPAFGMTLESAYTKLIHLCNSQPDASFSELGQGLIENWAGEYTPS